VFLQPSKGADDTATAAAGVWDNRRSVSSSFIRALAGVAASGSSTRRHAPCAHRFPTAARALVALTLAHVALPASIARADVLDAAYEAAYVAQTVPEFIELYAPASVSVTMRNTGTATWRKSEGDVFLATQEPQDNYFWCIQDNPHGMYSGNRVLLPHDVAPGETVTFEFVVKPLTCGFTAAAPFRFRMLSQQYGTFGEETPDPGAVLSTASAFVSQQAPAIAPAGARIPVTVVFRNVTPSVWRAADGYALVPAAPPGNKVFGVTSVPLGADVAAGGVASFTFDVDMPAVVGTYNFQWQMTRAGNAFGEVSPTTPIEVVKVGPANYQGLWWAAPAGSESGWGINLAHQGDTIFATWFTYGADRRPLWLSMAAQQAFDGRYSGTLVQTTGPSFDSGTFRPERVRTFAVGTGTLAFDEAGGGTFTFTQNGVSRTKPIVRQAFGLLPTCTFALVNDLRSAYNYQDHWWASPSGSEPGWGISLSHQDDVVFAVWFTYDRDGAPLWLSVTAPKTRANTYAGTLYRTLGPPLDTLVFDPSRVTATAVGDATLTFANGNEGTFAWSVGEVTGSSTITRQVFDPPGTICQ
jgi:hypothetical protein